MMRFRPAVALQMLLFTALLPILLPGASTPVLAAPGAVTLLRTPHGGIQPQAAVDGAGGLHLIYFQGDPDHGNIFYVHKRMGADAPFSAPTRVNSVRGSAMATGTIRGAQMALGKNGRVHVSWNGVGAKGSGGYSELCAAYTRMNDAGTAFEPERDLLPPGEAVDGGGSVAADARGNVYVTWHSSPRDKDEAAGAVFLARSTDNGRTFAAGKRISEPPTGQCGCCSMRAFVDHAGDLYVLYRAAGANRDRDSTLLVSHDAGATFRSAVLDRWRLGTCPMSGFSFAEETGGGVLGAWETAGRVCSARLDGAPTVLPLMATGTNGKYPVLAAGPARTTLLAWVEGAGWGRGGSLAWQVYDEQGTPTGSRGRVDGVPVWSLVTAAARPDGSFLLVY